jgi:hypothetical protein
MIWGTLTDLYRGLSAAGNQMKYLIVEPLVKAIAPNIALMKWARWCELNNHQYQYVRGIIAPDIEPDKILMSCIFTFDSKIYEKTIKHYWKLFPNSELTVGGVFPSLNPKWFQELDFVQSLRDGY